MIAPGAALDPTKYFIVIPNLFGNGLSSSPSNTGPPFDRHRYPHFTIYDNVVVQHRLLSEVLRHRAASAGLRLVDGRHPGIPLGRAVSRDASSASASRAARRASRRTTSYSWRASRRRLPRIPAGRTAGSQRSPSAVFAPSAASTQGGRCRRRSIARRCGGARVSRRWKTSWSHRGRATFLRRDANNLLAHHLDVAARRHQRQRALRWRLRTRAWRRSRARACIMPCETDLYFTVEDNRRECALLRNAELIADSVHLGTSGRQPGRQSDRRPVPERLPATPAGRAEREMQ